ncbi:hypothetical protein [Leptolyngbya sp. FACHB-711]|uniref:hypothetical protein n=1 Tax=unclassified Leptolyngbya TaxID=2650499 RepID=UPI0016859523|nr:hypothetical protein [Leptolyngbya sp. FACHB-711]MBD1853801.1 hypothetical protein [Cyanobacteria bacterium FACHB-502]MBD2027398.1 hypothetical protein [Leptolyngbya sp. FACHB-711]
MQRQNIFSHPSLGILLSASYEPYGLQAAALISAIALYKNKRGDGTMANERIIKRGSKGKDKFEGDQLNSIEL